MPFLQLGEDIWVQIAQLLPEGEISCMMMTCRQLYQSLRLASFWQHRYAQYAVSCPPPHSMSITTRWNKRRPWHHGPNPSSILAVMVALSAAVLRADQRGSHARRAPDYIA